MRHLRGPVFALHNGVGRSLFKQQLITILCLALSTGGLRASYAIPALDDSLEKYEEYKRRKAEALEDFAGRMTPEFKVDERLQGRVGFWFDIYARHGETKQIIHHTRYPWIIYEIVDTAPEFESSKGPLWLRRDRGNRRAKARARLIRRTLRNLSKRKTFANLKGDERMLFNLLNEIPGSRRKVLRQAAGEVRIQLGQRDFFAKGLVNSSQYLAHMETIFADAGLPTELTRMPFVESSFNEAARSRVGASGIWQIMPQTGKAYMVVNRSIDERNSPIKATEMAAKLLRNYFRALDSWPLAITSYNHGIGNIQKAMRRARSRELPVIIDRYHAGAFKFASSNFYCSFLAALYAEKYSELFFKEKPRKMLREFLTITLANKTRIRTLVKKSGLNKDDFLAYNLDLKDALKQNALLPRGFRVHLPPSAASQVPKQIGIAVEDQKSRPEST